MRILVTGGAGFIGSHVAEEFINAGCEVLIVDDLSSGRRENVPVGAKFVELDICSKGLKGVFEEFKPDYVAHLAAQIDVRKSVADPIFDAQVNILGGINVLEQSVSYGVKKFIFASTGGAIYGEADILPVPESYNPKPLSPYGTSKLAFEHYIGLFQRLYGLRYMVLRLPNVYGPRQSPEGEAGVCSILSGLMLKGRKPVLYGFGEPMRDYVYVKDIARAFLLAIEKGENEVVNLGSARGTKVREIFDIIAKLTGFEGEPYLAPLRQGEVHSIYISGDKAKQILGWEPRVSLEEGLRYTVEYVKGTL